MSADIPPWQIAQAERFLREVQRCEDLELLAEMLRPAARVGEAQPPSLLLLDLLEAEIDRRRTSHD